MKTFLNQKEIKENFDEFVEEGEIELNEKKNFNDFLGFLEIDIYDWVKENLRCYFRDQK